MDAEEEVEAVEDEARIIAAARRRASMLVVWWWVRVLFIYCICILSFVACYSGIFFFEDSLLYRYLGYNRT